MNYAHGFGVGGAPDVSGDFDLPEDQDILSSPTALAGPYGRQPPHPAHSPNPPLPQPHSLPRQLSPADQCQNAPWDDLVSGSDDRQPTGDFDDFPAAKSGLAPFAGGASPGGPSAHLGGDPLPPPIGGAAGGSGVAWAEVAAAGVASPSAAGGVPVPSAPPDLSNPGVMQQHKTTSNMTTSSPPPQPYYPNDAPPPAPGWGSGGGLAAAHGASGYAPMDAFGSGPNSPPLNVPRADSTALRAWEEFHSMELEKQRIEEDVKRKETRRVATEELKKFHQSRQESIRERKAKLLSEQTMAAVTPPVGASADPLRFWTAVAGMVPHLDDKSPSEGGKESSAMRRLLISLKNAEI